MKDKAYIFSYRVENASTQEVKSIKTVKGVALAASRSEAFGKIIGSVGISRSKLISVECIGESEVVE